MNREYEYTKLAVSEMNEMMNSYSNAINYISKLDKMGANTKN